MAGADELRRRRDEPTVARTTTPATQTGTTVAELVGAANDDRSDDDSSGDAAASARTRRGVRTPALGLLWRVAGWGGLCDEISPWLSESLWLPAPRVDRPRVTVPLVASVVRARCRVRARSRRPPLSPCSNTGRSTGNPIAVVDREAGALTAPARPGSRGPCRVSVRGGDDVVEERVDLGGC